MKHIFTSALYTAFTAAKPVFFAALLTLSLPVMAADYTVEGVEVDVTASNAVKAREKALGEAQVKAFGQLADDMMTPEARAAYTLPDADTIMALVQDYEVTNEQLSATRYKGIYTVRFRPALAQQYLNMAPAYETAMPYGTDPYSTPSVVTQTTTTHNNINTPSAYPAGGAPVQPAYQPPPATVYGQPAMIRARFAGVQEWVRLKTILERSRAFGFRRVVTLSPSDALVELSYDGRPYELQQALLGAGLNVSPAQGVAMDTQAPLFDVGFGGYGRY